jgi:acid stress chaperone HdeB
MQEQDIPTSMARLLRPPAVAKHLSTVQHSQAGREDLPRLRGADGDGTMRALLILLGLIFVLQAASAARAQVMLDVAKITCEQFTGYKITNPQNIAMWLSGYYNGKRGNTILDAQGLNANVKKLEGYCIKNPKTLVMQAVETVLGPN